MYDMMAFGRKRYTCTCTSTCSSTMLENQPAGDKMRNDQSLKTLHFEVLPSQTGQVLKKYILSTALRDTREY